MQNKNAVLVQVVSYASWLLRYMADSIENPANNEYVDYDYTDYNNNALVVYNNYELQPTIGRVPIIKIISH